MALTLCLLAPSLVGAQTVSDDSQWLTDSVVLVADNQEHETRGNPEFDMSAAIASFGPPAFRPAQMNLFALHNLAAVVALKKPLLHLGDALDMSCLSEWRRFELTMAAAGAPWLLAPGNHDGFVLGNQIPLAGQREGEPLPSLVGKLGVSRDGWRSLCDQGRFYGLGEDRTFDKNRFIRAYLTGLQLRYSLAIPEGDSGEVAASDPRSFLQRVAWSIDKGSPWRSFIVQEALLPAVADDSRRVRVLLVDTSHFDSQPALAGENGAIGDQQVRVLRRWMEKIIPSGDLIFLAGHHNVEQWSSITRETIGRLVKDHPAIRMVLSAHTHKGHWRAVSLGSTRISELNIGSLMDAPVHFRELAVGVKNGATVVRSPRHVLALEMDCSGVTLPKRKEPHSLDSQLPPSPVFGLMMSRAIWHWKNKEAVAELALYEDVVKDFFPGTPSSLSYSWEEGRTTSLTTHAEILAELDALQTKKKDPHRRRIRFLLALEASLGSGAIPESVSRFMRCQAVLASEEWAGGTRKKVADILKDTAREVCEISGTDGAECALQQSRN